MAYWIFPLCSMTFVSLTSDLSLSLIQLQFSCLELLLLLLFFCFKMSDAISNRCYSLTMYSVGGYGCFYSVGMPLSAKVDRSQQVCQDGRS